MASDSGIYRAIQELEREARDLERTGRDLEIQLRDNGRKLAKVKDHLVGLRRDFPDENVTVLPVKPVEPLSQPSNGKSFSLESEAGYASASYQKGDIIRLVLDALEEKPGLRSSQLGDLLKDKVTSGAKNPRKLIINAVSYLAATKRVRKLDEGGWELAKR